MNAPAIKMTDLKLKPLSLQPISLSDANNYVAEVVYKGVTAECRFELIVNQFTVDIIDIDGESPRVVKEGDCQTLSVSLNSYWLLRSVRFHSHTL